MIPGRLIAVLPLATLLLTSTAQGEEPWTAEQQQVLKAMEQLSAATAPGGAGPEAYAKALSDDYSRWTPGGKKINDKQSWVEGVSKWFTDGWRVSDRSVEQLEITIAGDHAFSRRIVTESYTGPDGKKSPPSTTALAEVWIRDNNRWLLLRVDAHPVLYK